LKKGTYEKNKSYDPAVVLFHISSTLDQNCCNVRGSAFRSPARRDIELVGRRRRQRQLEQQRELGRRRHAPKLRHAGLSRRPANQVNTNNISNLNLNRICFAGAGGGYDIRGNGFALTNSIMATNTAGANTIENNITFSNTTITILVSNSVSLTLAGSLSASVFVANVTKIGPGTLIYSGSTANTYTNLTTVNEGELDLAKTGVQAIAPFGAGLVIGDGSGTDTVRYMGNNQIWSVVTPITINSSGVLDLNGYNDTASPLTLNGGQITTGAGVLTVSGTVKIGGNATVSGNIALSSTLIFTNTVASTILHMNAGVSGSYGITKTGVGYLFLSASNSYTGLTVVQQGWIYAQNNFALGSTNSGTVVSNGATLVLDGSIGITNESLTLNGPGVGSGWGALDVESGVNTWAGPITNNATSTLDSWSSTAALHIVGPISGAGGLELLGAAHIILKAPLPIFMRALPRWMRAQHCCSTRRTSSMGPSRKT